MQHCFRQLNIILLRILVLIATQVHKSIEDEITDNTLPVVFSDATQASWKSSKTAAKFGTQVSSLINDYCPNNLDKCSLEFWNKTRQFKSSDVVIITYTTKVSNLEVKFYARLPNGSDIRKDSKTVVPVTTLEEILWHKRHDLSAGVGLTVHSVGTSVATGLESKPTKLMNLIMIPVSFVALIVVCLLACCLHVCHKRKMKSLETQRRKQLAMKNKSKKLDFTASTPHAAQRQHIQDDMHHPERVKHQRFCDSREGDYPDQGHGEQEIDSHYQKQPRKKKKKKKKMYEDSDEGHGTLEIGERNHSVYNGETGNRENCRDTTEDNEGEVPEREGRKRKTKKKRKRHDHEQTIDDEGFGDANGTCVQRDDGPIIQAEHAYIPRQLPPVRTPRNTQHNSPEA